MFPSLGARMRLTREGNSRWLFDPRPPGPPSGGNRHRLGTQGCAALRLLTQGYLPAAPLGLLKGRSPSAPLDRSMKAGSKCPRPIRPLAPRGSIGRIGRREDAPVLHGNRVACRKRQEACRSPRASPLAEDHMIPPLLRLLADAALGAKGAEDAAVHHARGIEPVADAV